MDVNLTISLMRGQMGVVIEKAVNAAVETVLGEMIRVVSLKFEEFRREMTAKEKENENIRNMLEMSRCQMKTMRRYLNALTAREDRQALQNHRPVLVQFEPGRARNVHQARDVVPPRRCSASNVSPCIEVQNPVPKPARIAEPTWEKQLPAPTAQNVIQEPVPAESYTNSDIYSEDVHRPKLHMGPVKAENSSAAVIESDGLVAESSDPLWGQTPPAQQASSEVEHTDTMDPNLPPVADNSEVFNTATAACGESPFKIKQEEGEVEIVQVKEEPVEAVNSECARTELCQQAAEVGPGISLDLPLSQQCPQISCPSITEPSFMGVDPSTYAESQLAMASGQRQVRPWCKDLNLYEEYKRKRIEVRKRSETRRRELEQTLPQALLADLVKERREKTRLRVARWRAKRKLQACLMSQAAQLNGAPAQGLFTQRGSRRRGGATAQQGGFALGRPGTSETGAYTLPLQIGTSPLLAAQRLSVAEGQMQPGSAMFQQHRTPAAGSEMFQ
ncbi:uncharacterized protein si:ch211-67e16.4 isoform X1 [Colossoma macropomum]|uniref:uncharacterized protein si:ch211-67e16.4 isoform X1 n=1 Tax=Colossoma macropomum TaxID=42526 RepID=UPI001863FAEB|nr:uncharacterized protein si:ch211-67e16.4 isoform X1 [Colossoma macropomum]